MYQIYIHDSVNGINAQGTCIYSILHDCQRSIPVVQCCIPNLQHGDLSVRLDHYEHDDIDYADRFPAVDLLGKLLF